MPTDRRTTRAGAGPDLRLWRRLTLRILLAAGLAATLGVAFAGVSWTLFFMDEIRTQLIRHTEDVVADNLERCRGSPATFGRDREVGRFDAYDASTLLSANPRSPAPDPVLVAGLAKGKDVVGRVYWSWKGTKGGAVLKRVGVSGPCTLFQIQWFAPRDFWTRLAQLLVALTLLAVAGTVALSTAFMVRPLAGRLVRLCRAAEQIGEPFGYEPRQDGEADEIGELSRILDQAHERIRTESARLQSRAEVLERHLADVSHDLRTPLTSIQIALEQAIALAEDRNARDLIRRALTDTVYTSELTENLRLAARLREGVNRAREGLDIDLTAIVERVVGRFALLGKHRGVRIEGAVPGLSLVVRAQPLWVEQAVANVVHNAVTHGGEGSHVAILLEAHGDDRFRLTVLDDGRGGAPAELQGLSAGTFRLDLARPRDPPGSGLGLALTAEICRINGWTLCFQSQEPGGLGVTIEGALVRPATGGSDEVALRDSGARPPMPAHTPCGPVVLPSTRRAGERSDAPRTCASLAGPDRPRREDSDQGRSLGARPSRGPAEASAAGSRLWRRLTPRILLAAGLAAVLSVVGMGGLWIRLLLKEILVQIGRYTHEITIDNVPVCLSSPVSCCRLGSIGRLDGYDARTFRSANKASPPLDSVLLERLRAGERDPARFLGSWNGQWGGAALKRVASAGVCSLFQLSWQAAPGSAGRGLWLLVVLTVVSLGGTMALSTVVAARPLVRRLLRLRRAAEFLGEEKGYEPGEDREADEIGHLGKILARAHARVRIESLRLRARQNALERHLGDIAHDLRTPLTSAQMALEQATRLLPGGESRGFVCRALTDTVYTAELTENLRLATQLREGADPLDRDHVTELAAIVERIVARFSLLGRHRGVILEGAYPKRTVVARGHPVWAEQAVANVVHNAVTHGHEGGHVAVVLEIVGEAGFSITIVDDGPGVPPAELARIPERSFRARRARQSDPAGSGLGLAITSEICRRSGWSLRFETEEPQGLRVTIEGELMRPPRERGDDTAPYVEEGDG